MLMNDRATIADLKRAVLDGERVVVRGFGVFNVTEIPPRSRYVPSTGETVTYTGRKRVSFSAADPLRKTINGDDNAGD